MSTGKKPRNRERILPDERTHLDSQVRRLQSWHQIPIRTTNRVLVDVDTDLGRVIRNASKRERWVFSSVAAERAAAFAAAFDLFSESAELPNAGTSRENRCAVRPICAKSPSAIPAASVKNRKLCQSNDPDKVSCRDADKKEAVSIESSSDVSLICCGVRDNA